MKPVSTLRLMSLDAYRGIVMMALVTGGGLGLERLRASPRFGWLAGQLEHKEWEGCSAWDLVQPAFMFIVGVAMPFAAAKRGRSLVRALKLAALGILLDAWQRGRLEIELISVLQQIALAYAFVALLLARGPRTKAAVAAALLALHTLAFVIYGRARGMDPWSRADNVGIAIDRALHLPLDPEGYVTFTAVSATATVLFGALAGDLLRVPASARWKLTVLAIAGAAGVLLGSLLAHAVPMVKHIWTSSFGLYASGVACLSFAFCYAAIDVWKAERWALPLVVVGMNSIAVYVFSGLFTTPLRLLLRPLAGGTGAVSLVAAGVWLLAYALYRRRIFIKV